VSLVKRYPDYRPSAWSARLERWMYPDGRPNRLARLLNRAWAVLHASGLLPPRLVTLEVPGRRTGRTREFPLVVADLGGQRYLVSMLGEDSNWVRNVRAAGGQAVLRHGGREPVRLEEVKPGLRAPIVRRYLALAPGPRAFIPVDRDAPVASFEPVVAHIPVFRVVPDQHLSGAPARRVR
jgi:deazaflavin-dependent oxidoreductase (nitroreductase family)